MVLVDEARGKTRSEVVLLLAVAVEQEQDAGASRETEGGRDDPASRGTFVCLGERATRAASLPEQWKRERRRRKNEGISRARS